MQEDCFLFILRLDDVTRTATVGGETSVFLVVVLWQALSSLLVGSTYLVEFGWSSFWLPLTEASRPRRQHCSLRCLKAVVWRWGCICSANTVQSPFLNWPKPWCLWVPVAACPHSLAEWGSLHRPVFPCGAASVHLCVLMPSGCRPIQPQRSSTWVPPACAARSWPAPGETLPVDPMHSLGTEFSSRWCVFCLGTIPLVSVGWHPLSPNTHTETRCVNLWLVGVGVKLCVYKDRSAFAWSPFLLPHPSYPFWSLWPFFGASLKFSYCISNEIKWLLSNYFCPLIIPFLWT